MADQNTTPNEGNQSEMFKAMVDRVKQLEEENAQLREEQRVFLNNWSTTKNAPAPSDNKPKFRFSSNGKIVPND